MYTFGKPIYNNNISSKRNITFKSPEKQLISTDLLNSLKNISANFNTDTATFTLDTAEFSNSNITELSVESINSINGSDNFFKIISAVNISRSSNNFISPNRNYILQVNESTNDIYINNRYVDINNTQLKIKNSKCIIETDDLSTTDNVFVMNLTKTNMTSDAVQTTNANPFNFISGILAKKSLFDVSNNSLSNLTDTKLGYIMMPNFDVNNSNNTFSYSNSNSDTIRFDNNKSSVRFMYTKYDYGNDSSLTTNSDFNTHLAELNSNTYQDYYLPLEIDRLALHGGIISNPIGTSTDNSKRNISFHLYNTNNNNNISYFDIMSLVNNYNSTTDTILYNDNILEKFYTKLNSPLFMEHIDNTLPTIYFNNNLKFNIPKDNTGSYDILNLNRQKLSTNVNISFESKLNTNYDGDNNYYGIEFNDVINIFSGTDKFMMFENGNTNHIYMYKDTTVNGDLVVTGATDFSNMVASGDFKVEGESFFYNTLNVIDKTDVNNHIVLLNVDKSSGNTTIGGNLQVDNEFYLHNNFNIVNITDPNNHIITAYIESNTGNIDTNGTITLTGMLNANGGIVCDTNKFIVTNTGNTTIGGTLDVNGTTTLTGMLNANGGIVCDTNKFIVTNTGNTTIGGTLDVNGTTTITGNLNCDTIKTVNISNKNGATQRLNMLNALTIEQNTNDTTNDNLLLLKTQDTGWIFQRFQGPNERFDIGIDGSENIVFRLGNGSTKKFFFKNNCQYDDNVTITGMLNANGGITCDTNKFIVADTTGNTTIGGTLDVNGTTTLTGMLNANGGIVCDTNKFIVTNTGNTTIGGTLDVNGKITIGDPTNSNTGGTINSGNGTITIDPHTVGNNSGSLIIAGDLIVNGTTTSVNSTTINIGDNIIILNNNESGIPSQNAGIEIERGTFSNVSFIWNETNDEWTTGNENLNVGGTITGPTITSIQNDITTLQNGSNNTFSSINMVNNNDEFEIAVDTDLILRPKYNENSFYSDTTEYNIGTSVNNGFRDDNLTIPNQNTNKTVELTFKTETSNFKTTGYALFTFGYQGSSFNTNYIFVQLHYTAACFNIWTGNSPQDLRTININVNNVFDGNWHHLMVLIDPSNLNIKLYLDNSQIGSETWSSINYLDHDTSGLTIGLLAPSNDRPFTNGYIKDFYIYDRLLSTQEMNNRYSIFQGNTVSSTNNIKIGNNDITLSSAIITGMLNANGGIVCDTNKFIVTNTGNTTIGGTLDVNGTTTITGNLNCDTIKTVNISNKNGATQRLNMLNALTIEQNTNDTTNDNLLLLKTQDTGWIFQRFQGPNERFDIGIDGSENIVFRLGNGSTKKFFFKNNCQYDDNVTITGMLNANGGITCDTNKFIVADTTGNTTIGGTLDVNGTTTLTGMLNANGGIVCDTNKFIVADTTGNTTIGGTFNVKSTSILENTLTISSTDTTGSQLILKPADVNDRAIVSFYKNDGAMMYCIGAREDTKHLIFSATHTDPTYDTTPTLCLSDNENVGIGTDNPSYKLDVRGTCFLGNTGNTVNIPGLKIRQRPAAISNPGSDYIQIGQFADIDNDTSGTDGSVFIIKNDGKVGIGLTNPIVSLHVNGSGFFQGDNSINGLQTPPGVALGSASNLWGQIQIISSHDDGGWIDWVDDTGNSDFLGRIRYGVNNGFDIYAENGCNINTHTHINGRLYCKENSTNGVIVIGDNSDQTSVNNFLLFRTYRANATTYDDIAYFEDIRTNNTDPSIFHMNGNIRATGKIGIGTTTPKSALHIVGAKDNNTLIEGIHLGHNGNPDYGIDFVSGNNASGVYLDFNRTNSGIINYVGRFYYLFSNNTFNFTRTINAPGWSSSSDDRLKHNEININNALKTIMKLSAQNYDKTNELKEEDFKGELKEGLFTKESGFIAQEVYMIDELKHLVTVGDEKTPWGINYNGLFTYNIQATQELNNIVKEQKDKIDNLEKTLLNKNNIIEENKDKIDNLEKIILNQNNIINDLKQKVEELFNKL